MNRRARARLVAALREIVDVLEHEDDDDSRGAPANDAPAVKPARRRAPVRPPARPSGEVTETAKAKARTLLHQAGVKVG